VTRTLARALILAAAIACLFVLNSFFEPHYDFSSFWGAGRALLQGRNPYDYEVIQDILEPRATANFNYPLYIAVLVVPLGLFDLETAKNIWLTLSEILFVLSIYLLGRRRPKPREFVFSTIACAAYVPTLIAFFDQQTSMVSLFLISLAYYGVREERRVLAGTALALSLIKPQTVALVLPVTLLRLRKDGLASFGLASVGLLGIAFGLMHDWPVHWWWSASWITKEAGRAVPTVWGLSWYLFSRYWPGAIMAMGLLATVLLNTEFSFVLTVGLLVPVYMKPYDLVLLLVPALSRRAGRLLAVLVVASYLLLAYAALSARGGDIFIMLTLLTIAYLLHADRAEMLQRLHGYRKSLVGRVV
jgi:hypothetical protein